MLDDCTLSNIHLNGYVARKAGLSQIRLIKRRIYIIHFGFITKINNYVLAYLLTCLLHGAESFLRS